ncbi:uncharacterized protein PRCAT00004986001 [Priceomyces carsonii]|nr:unnamed protein product [Priceomyces carsonii]
MLIFSANSLVVKSNVPIVGPPVRFRVCALIFFYDFLLCSPPSHH